MRIGIGGFQHETNTFAPSRATWEDFAEKGGGWPRLVSGPAMFAAVAGANIPVAGFIEAMAHHTLVPTTWAAASPSGLVTKDAFERISALILQGLSEAMPLDGVYLDLHGAMVTEHLDDGEGELLRRVRELVGPGVPVVASLDLHANVTRAMVRHADALVCYRTYPHIDMAETGQRAGALLSLRLAGVPRPYASLRALPYLISLCWQSTDIEPSRSLYEQVGEIESRGVTSLSFATGFPAADFPECAPTVWAYGTTQADADAAAAEMARAVLNAERDFGGRLYTPDEAVQEAMRLSQDARKPIVIADAQDNPGAGGSSDTTGVLRALIRHDARDASIGLIVDPAAALAAHRAGVGNKVRIALGGHSGIPDDEPLDSEFIVEKTSDGRFDTHGAFYRGFHMDLGPSACLRIGGVRIIVATNKVQMADQEMFRFAGVEPTRAAILVVKSSAHFRADFTSISQTILVCAAPGSMLMDAAKQPWTRLRPGIRMAPCGPVFSGRAATA
ncbi:M81 family metallopeptidase [Achromobacter sp. UMC46]|uniref:M81 family metallopeptidase n=1 Tax=Achromobacter sp. UMC46 TaxID=1862319 RepID=UPI0016023D79|nr:M81 family metallopeptidase [Achromobacter sp. UMC46]MBB1594520.1 microcystin degradation protein MlrC [Achromobacter sp. UMC46]